MASVMSNPKFTPISPFNFNFNNSTRFLPHNNNSFLLYPHKQTPFAAAIAVVCSVNRRPDYIPCRIPDPNYVRIFDTTLRDGEQSPGATMTSKEKLDIARQLAKLGVDIIEAGFPAASKEDFEAVKMIAVEVGNAVDENGYVPVICGFARCYKRDIDVAWEAVKRAKRPRINPCIATSEIHMKHKLKKTKEEVLELARSMVRYARSLGCADVEFTPEDGGRSDREFLYLILGEAIKAGATTVSIPDTVGYNMPNEFGQLLADIKTNTPGIENVVLSTHCHNDLGLAAANTLAGLCIGARQVEVTINGIGERAGNASLEEILHVPGSRQQDPGYTITFPAATTGNIVMALKCRGEQVLGGLHTGINTEQIITTSKMVEEYSGLHVQPNKAIVGANAFAHGSGIHQDGMLKHQNTYQIMSPKDIGLHRSHESGIVLGKLSGRHALKFRLSRLGCDIEGKELDDFFWHFKVVAEKKKSVTDEDLMALVSDVVLQPLVVWKLVDVQVASGSLGVPMATVKLMDAEGQEHIACANGTGPVDSAYKAVDLIVKLPITLLEYSMNAVTEGIDAIATTRVVIREDNDHTSTNASGEIYHRTFSGTGAEIDIVVSSVRAYISALNKMLSFKKQPELKANAGNSWVTARADKELIA